MRILEFVSKNKITNAIYSNDYLNFNLIDLSRTLEHHNNDEEKVFKDFLWSWNQSCKFDMKAIYKKEINIDQYQEVNIKLKEHFEMYKKTELTKLCPCLQSTKNYGDCCHKKIAHFLWGTFYER